MKFTCMVISVSDINTARKFYEDLFGLDGHIIEVGEDMKMVIKRFLDSGMTMEQVSVKMDASIGDLTRLLNS